jgi:hypothetical protein
MEVTIYKADFSIKCWHEFCGSCEWRVGKKCLLFEQRLKEERYGMFDEGPSIVRCKVCMSFCANMPREDIYE